MSWITTKDGRHVNTDWFEKDKQIASNTKEANERNAEANIDLSSLDYKEADAWMNNNSNYKSWQDKMFDEEIDETIYQYTAERFALYNNYLRRGDTSRFSEYYNKEDANREIRELDKAINEFKLDKPITVYRESDSSLLGKNGMSYEQIKALEGKSVIDKAFTSTSTRKSLPGEQTVGGEIKYKIDIPAGKGHGAYIAKYSENKQEQEFLIKRGTNYNVHSVTKNKYGQVIVYLRIKN